MKSGSSMKYLRDICEKRGMYDTPELNTVLWLNDLQITELPAMDLYCRVRCLHLENNYITDGSALRELHELHSLYLTVCTDTRISLF